MSKEPVDPLQLPEAAEWIQCMTAGASVLDFVGQRVGLAGTLAVTRLLNPSFVEVQGCVLLPWRFDEEVFQRWWAQLDGDRSAIEYVFNHTHLWDVFHDLPDDPLVDSALVDLGEIIAESWRLALAREYPEGVFTVSFVYDDDNEYGPTVTFGSEAR